MGLIGDAFSVFGKEKSKAQPQKSGYAAMPKEFQDQFNRYNNQLTDLYGDANKRLNPDEYIQGFSPEYQALLQQIGLGVNDDLSPYMNQYLDDIFALIDRQAGAGMADFTGRAATSGDIGGFYSSSRQNANQGLQEAAMRQKGLAAFDATNQAIQNRNQYLQQQLGAQEAQRQMGQRRLDLNNPYLKNQQYAQGLQFLPGSQIGPQKAQPGGLQRLGGFLNYAEDSIGDTLTRVFGGGF